MYRALGCPDPPVLGQKCTPLSKIKDNSAKPCAHADTCCSGPIEWSGQFPVANTVSETLLLEYASGMTVGWEKHKIPADQMRKMVKLHDVYFDKTQREDYLASIDASNLIREISETLDKAKGPCRKLRDDVPFNALVGHDTNIAAVASLLGLKWYYDHNAPVGTRGLPENDPLPAGALVFEVWQRTNDLYVKIVYMAQGLDQMRACKDDERCPAFRLPVQCPDHSARSGFCEMRLVAFTALARKIAPAGSPFLCCAGKHTDCKDGG